MPVSQFKTTGNEPNGDSLLRGQSLTWISSDNDGTYAAMVRSELTRQFSGTSIRLNHIPLSSLAEFSEDQFSSDLVLGFGLWCMGREADLSPICRNLALQRSLFPNSVRIALCDFEHADCFRILNEAGAQIVARDVPSLQRAIASLLSMQTVGNPAAVPLSDQGFHPLTSGLVGRLPWPELDEPIRGLPSSSQAE